MENKEFAQDLKGMMDALDVIEKKVWEKYPNASYELKYDLTVRLFELIVRLFELMMGLDKNKGRD